MKCPQSSKTTLSEPLDISCFVFLRQADMLKRPVIFTTFCGKGNNSSYVAVSDMLTLKTVLDGKLQEYNESNAMMDLVLFDQAMVRTDDGNPGVVPLRLASQYFNRQSPASVVQCSKGLVVQVLVTTMIVRDPAMLNVCSRVNLGTPGTRNSDLPHYPATQRKRNAHRRRRVGQAVPVAAVSVHLWV